MDVYIICHFCDHLNVNLPTQCLMSFQCDYNRHLNAHRLCNFFSCISRTDVQKKFNSFLEPFSAMKGSINLEFG